MKILSDEIKRRFEEKRTAKSSLWSNWLIKIVILIALIILMRNVGMVRQMLNQEQREQSNGIMIIE